MPPTSTEPTFFKRGEHFSRVLAHRSWMYWTWKPGLRTLYPLLKAEVPGTLDPVANFAVRVRSSEGFRFRPSLFGFLTTDANAVVAPIHLKAMPGDPA
jgi:hypothetical protein